MSGVVLRCPQCGTTRSGPGECQACHEAQVRYYCTNHAPGRWLDKGACAQCGARFGDPAHPPSIPPATVRPTPTRDVPRAAPRAGGDRPLDAPRHGGPAPRPPVGPADDRSADSHDIPRRPVRPDATGVGSRPARSAPPAARSGRAIGDEPDADGGRPAPSGWRELLMAVARAQSRRAAEAEAHRLDRAADRPRARGCVSRMLMLMVMFFLVLYLFGGGILRIFMPW